MFDLLRSSNIQPAQARGLDEVKNDHGIVSLAIQDFLSWRRISGLLVTDASFDSMPVEMLAL